MDLSGTVNGYLAIVCDLSTAVAMMDTPIDDANLQDATFIEECGSFLSELVNVSGGGLIRIPQIAVGRNGDDIIAATIG